MVKIVGLSPNTGATLHDTFVELVSIFSGYELEAEIKCLYRDIFNEKYCGDKIDIGEATVRSVFAFTKDFEQELNKNLRYYNKDEIYIDYINLFKYCNPVLHTLLLDGIK